MKAPLLSLITINFNDIDGLKKTMASVLKQSFKDFEYLVIDGASTDGSAQYIAEHAEKLKFWRSEPDSGIYNAMNKGIAASSGEYLLFLNSGDTLTSANALKEFIQHPAFDGDIIYGDYKFDKGEKIYPDELHPSYFMKTSLPHQSTLFRQTVFDKMGLFDEKYSIAADRAFYIKCFLSKQFKFRHIPYFLTHFDLSGVSNDLNYLHRKQKEDQQMLKELYGNDYTRYKLELDEEIRRKAVPKYSPKGIYKRLKKRIQRLWNRH